MNRVTGGIHLYTGNRLEDLARDAACVLGQGHGGSPFDREVILVQTEGMKRWLSLQVASHNGIFSNASFISPADLVSMIERDVLSLSRGNSPYERNSFPWTIMKFLEEKTGKDPDLTVIGDYASGNALRLYQLSSRIADIFDQYAVYRPAMLWKWEEGGLYLDNAHEQWQRKIWLSLKDIHGSLYPNRLHALVNCLSALDSLSTEALEHLPRRLLVFGISVLPGYYLDLLRAMAAHVPVYLFLMNPSRHYWGEIRSDRELARLRRKLKNPNLTLQEYHYEKGNSLLASMGKTGRDFFSLVYGHGDVDADEKSISLESAGRTLLEKIQNDILELSEPGTESRIELSAEDDSIRVASCHSPMREVEVLHDYLLSLFDGDATLLASHVLVLTPDINAFAPYIDAVFGTAPEGSRFPYSIADRSVSAANRIASLFLSLCELAGSRLEVSRVLTFLAAEPVRDRFGLSLTDLDIIQEWVRDAGIRWGRDGASRERLGLPGIPDNTWSTGLDRMISGCAMAGGEGEFFDSVLPFDGIEGALTGVLGRFMTFMTGVMELSDGILKARSLSEWRCFFIHILEFFFSPGEDREGEFRYIRNQLDILERVEETSGLAVPVDFAVMKSYFSERFENEMTTRGFITGGLTFSSMVPLRSIPFRVICLLGMNDESFPRRTRPSGFDLMALAPLPGDRNTRESDRYLFLETLLSARERLYVSYVGRSVRDNTEMLPSSLVVELLDYIEGNYIFSDGENARSHIIVEHPLQAFSPRYFTGTDPGLFSYRDDNRDAATRLAAQVMPGRNFYNHRLPPDEPIEGESGLEAESLLRFLKNTSAHFLKERLLVDLVPPGSLYEDRELFTLEGLPRYLLGDDMLRNILHGADPRGLADLYRARGLLPHGTGGMVDFERLAHRAKEFSRRIVSTLSGRIMERRTVSVACDGIELRSMVGNLYGGELILFRPANIKPMDRLRTWIYHLMLCSSGMAVQSRFISFDMDLVMEPVEGARDLLCRITALYLQGLCRCLPFFPATSWAFYEGLYRGREPGRESAMKKARAVWNDSYRKTGEGRSDPYVEMCFGDMDITGFGDDFVQCAETVFGTFNRYVREEVPGD